MYKPDSVLAKIYDRLPPGLQNVAFTLVGFLNRWNRYGKAYRDWLALFLRTDRFTHSEIVEYQRAKLTDIVRVALESVPYYRNSDAYPPLADGEDPVAFLKQLPVLTKEVIKQDQTAFINEHIHPDRLFTNLTSGTSGQPLLVYHTRKSFAAQWAIWARHKQRFGVQQIGNSFLTFGARVPVSAKEDRPPYWRRNYAIGQTYLSIFHLSPTYLPVICDFLRRERFIYYTGYPSAMYVVSQYMIKHKITLNYPPKIVFTGSDALLPFMAESISQAFGAPVTEQYGMAESCGNFSKCEAGNFHLDFEFGYVEYLDIEHDPNSNLKRMVFTGLTNDAMPLLRYDVGDLCIPSDQKCECGRESPIVEAIVGRQEDYIVTPDQRKIQGLNQVFEWSQNTKEIQIIQQADLSLLIKYVPTSNFNQAVDLDLFKAELFKRIGEEMDVKFQEVNTIQKAKNGKYKAVVSLV